MRQRELVNAGIATVPALISGGDKALLRRNALGANPQRGKFDTVDAIAPCVPHRMHRFVEPVGELETIQLATGQFAERRELRPDFREHRLR